MASTLGQEKVVWGHGAATMNFFGAEAAEAAEPGFWQKAWEKVFPSAEAKRILGVEEVVASLERK